MGKNVDDEICVNSELTLSKAMYRKTYLQWYVCKESVVALYVPAATHLPSPTSHHEILPALDKRAIRYDHNDNILDKS
jgi:hypothetical protein